MTELSELFYVIITVQPISTQYLPTYSQVDYEVRAWPAHRHSSIPPCYTPGRAVRSCISACIPFFALLAVAALDAMLLLQSSGNVTPLALRTGLKDVFQQAVLLGGPLTLLHYMNIDEHGK